MNDSHAAAATRGVRRNNFFASEAGVRVRRLVAMLLIASPLATAAQPAPLGGPRSAPIAEVRHELHFDAAQAISRAVGVTMRFTVRGEGPVLLSLPAWTPGAYEVSDYARHVSGFSASAGPRTLRWDKLDPDTWRVYPEGARDVQVRFAVRADSLDNAFSWARDDFALINGTNVFLYPEGQSPELPASVRVRTDASWRVISAMERRGDEYVARSYHELVDAPFFVGVFDLDSTQVAGRWMRLATYPAGSVAGARRATLWGALQKAVPPQVAVFGEVPWSAYTILQIADSAYTGGMSALEHAASNVGIVGTEYLDEPFVPSVYAHEIFHAWNVKRLRPAELWPYRYGTAQPTPWLWMSEGITDYYADLSLVRGGAITAEAFRGLTEGKIDHVRQLPPVALEDASLEAWLRVTDGTSGIYYDKGSLAGLALDILIREASDNTASLDVVMRALYDSAYKAGRGFTEDEWWGAVTRAARGQSFRDFATRYIDGRDPYPWDQWLRLAGWRLVADTVREARLGIVLAPDSAGLRVTALGAGSVAVAAGVLVDDVLVSVDGVRATDPDFFNTWRDRAAGRDGAPLVFEVRRDGRSLTLRGVVRIATLISTRLEDDPRPSPRAARIRQGILSGTLTPR
jgi:predicted metalloprotease with PDZ domain